MLRRVIQLEKKHMQVLEFQTPALCAQKLRFVDSKEAGLDYPIGPLGTDLGLRAFRDPQALDKTNTTAILFTLPKFR